MEEKTRGTPNPLSPSIDATLLDANPSEVSRTAVDGVGPKHNKPAAPEAKHVPTAKAAHNRSRLSATGPNLSQRAEISTNDQPVINTFGWLDTGASKKSEAEPAKQPDLDSNKQLDTDNDGWQEPGGDRSPENDAAEQPEADVAAEAVRDGENEGAEPTTDKNAPDSAQTDAPEAEEQSEATPIEATGLDTSAPAEATKQADLAPSNDASDTELGSEGDDGQNLDQVSESFSSDGTTESDLAFDETTPEAEALRKADLAKTAAKATTAIPITVSTPPATPPTPKPTMMHDVIPPAGGRLVDPMIAARPSRAPRPVQSGSEQASGPVQSTTEASYAQPMGVVTSIDGSVPSQGQADPMNRPMEQVVLTETPKPKKKHTGLIIGIIVSLFLAIGCGVAALLLFLNPTSSDPVAKAVLKLVNDGIPENVKVSGAVDTTIDSTFLPVSDIKVNLNSEIIPGSLINSSTAKVEVDITGGTGLSVELSEVYAANGELFMKIDGIKDLANQLSAQVKNSADTPPLDDGTNATQEEVEIRDETNCMGGPEGTNCGAEVDPTEGEVVGGGEEELMTLDETLLGIAGTMNAIDGEWIRFSGSEVSSEISAIISELSTESNPLVCSAKLVSDAASDNNVLSQAYVDNPFIFSSSENVPIKGRSHTAYAMLVDEEKLREFLSQTSSSQTMRNFASCMGYGNMASGGADKLIAGIKELPQIYLEMDDEYNISRVYFAKKGEIPSDCDCYEDMVNCNDACLKSGDYEVVVDLNLSYPTNVNISAPTNYIDSSELANRLGIQTNVGPLDDGM